MNYILASALLLITACGGITTSSRSSKESTPNAAENTAATNDATKNPPTVLPSGVGTPATKGELFKRLLPLKNFPVSPKFIYAEPRSKLIFKNTNNGLEGFAPGFENAYVGPKSLVFKKDSNSSALKHYLGAAVETLTAPFVWADTLPAAPADSFQMYAADGFMDASGNFHGTYNESFAPSKSVGYYSNSSGVWVKEAIPLLSNTSTIYTRLILHNGQPYIAAKSADKNLLVSKVGGAWTSVEIPTGSSGNDIYLTSGAGKIHIIYARRDSGKQRRLYYRNYDGAAFSDELEMLEIDNSVDEKILRVDASGKVHLLFNDLTMSETKRLVLLQHVVIDSAAKTYTAKQHDLTARVDAALAGEVSEGYSSVSTFTVDQAGVLHGIAGLLSYYRNKGAAGPTAKTAELLYFTIDAAEKLTPTSLATNVDYSPMFKGFQILP